MSERLPPEQLDPRYCNAWNPKRLKHCRAWAGAGTPHTTGPCYQHGGRTPAHAVAADKRAVIAACAQFGVPIVTTGVDALLDELARAKGYVTYYEALARELELPGEPGGPPGIYGPTFHVSGIATGEAKPHVLMVMLMEERKHYLAVAAAVVKANVDERRVELAESAAHRDGAEIAARFRVLIRELGMSLDDPKVQAAARLALTQGTSAIEGAVAA